MHTTVQNTHELARSRPMCKQIQRKIQQHTYTLTYILQLEPRK